MDMETERRLMDDIRQGDQESFRTLVNPLIAQAYRTSLAILRSTHLAEEAVQNALVESYSAIVKGKEIRRFRGWFSRVIASRSLDIARKEQPNKYSVDIDGLEICDEAASPLDDVLKKEQCERLIESIMALELQQRAVIVLYYFEELRIEEIALLLNIREGTVKSRLYHARSKLSRIFPASRIQAQEVGV